MSITQFQCSVCKVDFNLYYPLHLSILPQENKTIRLVALCCQCIKFTAEHFTKTQYRKIIPIYNKLTTIYHYPIINGRETLKR